MPPTCSSVLLHGRSDKATYPTSVSTSLLDAFSTTQTREREPRAGDFAEREDSWGR